MREYVEEVAESYQVPVDMSAGYALGIVSLASQGKYMVEVKPDWKETLNIYLCYIGRPSERKTPVLGEVKKPVMEFMARENEARESQISDYEIKKKMLEKKLSNAITNVASKNGSTKEGGYSERDVLDIQRELDELEEVNKLELIADDTTPEALVKLLARNDEKASIVSDEGGIFGMMGGRYSDKVNIDIFLKAYSGEYYISHRAGSSGTTELKQPLLTMCLAVQPQTITNVMGNTEFRGRGLLARFLYCMPESRVGTRSYNSTPVSQQARQKYYDLINELLIIPDFRADGEIRYIHLSPEAQKLSEGYFYWIEAQITNEFEDIEDWAGKLHGNTMRIAGLLHIIEHRANANNVRLSEETMKNAITIGKYFVEHSMYVFDMSGVNEASDLKDARYLLKKIKQVQKEKSEISAKSYITRTDLTRKCHGRFGKSEDMESGLQCLIEHGYICIVKGRTGGRPTEKIYVYPEA